MEKANDRPTADMLTQRLDVDEKTAWMLRSLLEEQQIRVSLLIFIQIGRQIILNLRKMNFVRLSNFSYSLFLFTDKITCGLLSSL